MTLELDKDVVSYFTEAQISGTVTFIGNIEAISSDLEQNLSITVGYGDNPSDLTSAAVSVNDRQQDRNKLILRFKKDLSGLEDGAVYHYNAKAEYGDDPAKTAGPYKFLTLPKGPVDLDLKSGNLWSSTNLGAKYPEDAGSYYAWAEPDPKSANATFNWHSYKWCKGSYDKLTKYTDKWYSYDESSVDNTFAIKSGDDAANKLLKGSWHIPSSNELNELCESCIWTQGKHNKVDGYFVRSKTDPDNNKKVIFLPMKGYYLDGELATTYKGFYWSSNCCSGFVLGAYSAYYLTFASSEKPYVGNILMRCYGMTIRPVMPSK